MMSIWGILSLLSLPLRVVITGLKAFLFGGHYRKYSNHVLHSVRLFFFRSVLLLPVEDCKYIALPNKFLISKLIGLKNKSITSKLPGYGTQNDQQSIWLVKQPAIKKSDPILLYLHGGGYFLQTAPSQLESLISIYKLTTPHVQSKLSVLLLDYDLACSGYSVPHQLHQLHVTYTNLIDKGYRNIIFMGDSAGGHLAITYLQYLKQISYHVFPKKAILISPWVKLLPTEFTPGNSYYDNDNKDILSYSQSQGDGFMNHIVGKSDINSLLISPGNKTPYDAKDWEGIPTLNDPGHDVFVLAGEDEVFRDDVLEWCDYALDVPLYRKHQYGTSNNKFDANKHEYISTNKDKASVRVYVEPWGVHDSSLLLENEIINTIKKRPNLQLRDVDIDEFFGINRMVKFLNDTI